MKKLGLALLVLVLLTAGAAWADRYTSDDIMKGVQQLQIGQARIEGRMEGIEKRMDGLDKRLDSLDAGSGRLFTLVLSLFGIMAAALTGLFLTMMSLSREVRIPKEERVSKLEAFMEKVKEHLREIDDKLHIPKPIL